MTIPDNTQDVIDSRDVIDRIAELQEEIEESLPDADLWKISELAKLLRLADDASIYAERWIHGAILIRDSHFTDYAKQKAGDQGYLCSPDPDSWPYNHINWESAARELQMDYTAVDFDGVTYWIR